MNSHRKTGAKTHLFANAASSLDLFAKPVPVFNFRGRGGVSTWCGVLASLAVVALMLLYGYAKVSQLLLQQNANIVQYEVVDNFTDKNKISLLNRSTKVAFAITEFSS